MLKKSNILLKRFKMLIIVLAVTGIIMGVNIITFKSEILNNICGVTVAGTIAIIVLTMIKTDKAWKQEELEKIEEFDKFLLVHYGGKVRCSKGKLTKEEKDMHSIFKELIAYSKLQIEGQLFGKNFKYNDICVEEQHRSSSDKDDCMRYILFEGCMLQFCNNELFNNKLYNDTQVLICTSGFYKRTGFKIPKKKYSLICTLEDGSSVYSLGKNDIDADKHVLVYNRIKNQMTNILNRYEMYLLIRESTIYIFVCDVTMQNCELQTKLQYIESVLKM